MNRANPLMTLIALLAGLGLGLAYSWGISPVSYTDSTPNILRADFKDQYRTIIAAAFASNGDIERARARLSLLGDNDSFQALSAQAQQMLAVGRPYEDVEQIVQLASALQGQKIFASPTSPSSYSAQFTALPTLTPLVNAALVDLTTIPQSTPLVITTTTSRPTQTLSPTPGLPLILISQEEICNSELNSGLMQITILDERRRQSPGIELTITWDGGEEHFFTGLKPELGNGYADYQMTEGVTYSLKPENGNPIPNIIAPACPAPNGSFLGGIKFIFQKP